MAANRPSVYDNQFFNAGAPAAGFKLYTYDSGTTTPKATYTDQAGTIPNTNPITLDSDGMCELWLGTGEYTLALYTGLIGSGGALVNTWDDVSGVASAGDITTLRADIASSTDATDGAGMVGHNAALNYAAGTIGAVLNDIAINVKMFPWLAKTDGTDTTAALQAAINANVPLIIPRGTYKYTALTGLSRSGLRIEGAGSDATILHCTGAGEAFKIDGAGAFLQSIHVSGLTIKGNSSTTSLLYLRDVARSSFIDLNVLEADNVSGVGFDLLGVQLCYFERCMCSQDRQAMTSAPYIGIQFRVSAMLLKCTNNLVNGCYWEGDGSPTGIKIGIRLYEGDQNTFTGGSSESVRTYGVSVGTFSKMNTFIGVGFESANATQDIIDGGVSTKYLNCYASKSMLLQGRNAVIDGGAYERIEVQSGAVRNKVQNCDVNHWATGAGGLVDAGTGTLTHNVYDEDAGEYLQDIAPKFLAFAPADMVNQTGAGTAVTVAFAEVIDDNGNFNSNTFTAPISGRYKFSAGVSLKALSTAATFAALEIVTSNRTYRTEQGLNPKAGALQTAISLAVDVMDMDAGDTAFVRLTVSGMAGDTATIIGNASTLWTTFSGGLAV